jgi:Excreted virulence factor EspC, type VII ESX diderm
MVDAALRRVPGPRDRKALVSFGAHDLSKEAAHMPRIDVETGGLRAAGGSAESVAADLRGLAGEIAAALSGVGGAAPPQSSAASGEFSQALQAGALAIADGVGSLGANAVSAAGTYEQVDRQAMPR